MHNVSIQYTYSRRNSWNSWKSDNFCYRKVGRAILLTKWGAIEKSPILLSQLPILKDN